MLFFDFFKRKNLDWHIQSTLKTIKKKHCPTSELPFPHVIIDNAFPEKIHRGLTREFQSAINRGLSLTWNKNLFSRLAIYNAYIWTPNPASQSFSNIFFTHEWLNFIAGFFPDVKRTNNTGVTFHHHSIKSQDTLIQHGMAYGAFKNDPLPNGINAWYHQCKHTQDPTLLDTPDIFHEVRAIAIVYFLNNKPWQKSGGGEISLYHKKEDNEPSVAIAPINNRLLIFEATPHSFHAFKKNLIHERNCIIQWIFEKSEDTFRKYNKKNIVPWTQIKTDALNRNYPINPKVSAPISLREKPKTILLIGCSGKLGTAFIQRYTNQYHIIGVARDTPAHRSLLHDFIQADASWEWESIIDTALSHHGSIDILINNAASYNHSPLLEKEIHHFSAQLQMNLIAPFAFAQTLLRKDWLRFSCEENCLRNRLIINIGSVSGTKVRKNISQGTYSTTKAALHMLTLHMAAEWDVYGIRANTIAFHGFRNRVSPETATTAIEACINNRDATGQIYLVSDTKIETYSGLDPKKQ